MPKDPETIYEAYEQLSSAFSGLKRALIKYIRRRPWTWAFFAIALQLILTWDVACKSGFDLWCSR